MSDPVVYRIKAELLPRACLQAAAVFVVAALLALGVNSYRQKSIPLLADWSPAARLNVATGASTLISLKTAVTFYDAQEAVFVDARPRDLFADGHISRAH